MATDGVHVDITLNASGDLSTKQYRFVTIDSSAQSAIATRGALAVGIQQDKPAAAGRASQVRISGISKVVLGGSVTKGQAGVSDVNGAAVTTSSSDTAYMGFFLDSGASGEIVPFLLQPRGLS